MTARSLFSVRDAGVVRPHQPNPARGRKDGGGPQAQRRVYHL